LTGFIIEETERAEGTVWWNKVPMYTGFRDGECIWYFC